MSEIIITGKDDNQEQENQAEMEELKYLLVELVWPDEDSVEWV